MTDGVFSMDGDIAPLEEIVELAQRYDARVMVDDAHASGVFGSNGRGTVDHFQLHGRVDIQVGTLSKAVGVLGGLQLFLSRTDPGRRMRATAQDPDTAELVGIDARAVYARATAIAVAIAGLAGLSSGALTGIAALVLTAAVILGDRAGKPSA